MQQREASHAEKWQTVITPRNKLFYLDVKGLWQYRDLIFLFVRRNFKVLYQQTALGPLWVVLNPVITTITFTLIFGNVAGLSTDHTPQFLFYMLGNAGWSLFSNNVAQNAQTFIQNRNIFSKVYFPRLVLPISITFSNLLNFLIQMGIFMVFWVYYIVRGALAPNWPMMLAVPLLVLQLAVLGVGCGVAVSALTTKYRDLITAVGFGLQLWMYATPVVYPISELASKIPVLRILLLCNPVAPPIETLRYALFGKGSLLPGFIALSVAETLIICLVGVVLFNRIEKTFVDTV